MIDIKDIKDIIDIALGEGFADAAIIDTADIVFDASFRPYCEENLCGWYGANYTCPPDCGTPEEMKKRVKKHKHALQWLESIFLINCSIHIFVPDANSLSK